MRISSSSLLLGVATLSLTLTLAACGGDSSGPPPAGAPSVPPPSVPEPGGGACEGGEAFESTFAAIQSQIFERHGCTQNVCHGDARSGGLDLRAGAAYANLVEVPSSGSTLPRVVPGDKSRSFLWLKLAAKTAPGSVTIAGSPMPSGLPAISEDELEGLRLWIYSGAPGSGTVNGTEALPARCLPDPQPISIKPLEPPAPGEGLQFVLPPLEVKAASEQEVCFATYYDVREQVPVANQDSHGRYFRYSGQEL